YAWLANLAWKTSWIPGTAGFHARTHSRGVSKMRRSYKTDPYRPASLGPVHQVIGLLAFAFAGSVSPGPYNTLLWASGMRFGFVPAIPHVLGTAIGIGALFVGVAAGIGVAIQAVPALETVLKVIGSLYLLVLAYLVLGSGTVGGTHVSHPLGLWQATAFQF